MNSENSGSTWDFGDARRHVKAGYPVVRFRIELPLRDETLPIDEPRRTVSRLIEVPETYSFWDLHVAIQSAMGWLDSHLHEFRITTPGATEDIVIGLDDVDAPAVVAGRKSFIAQPLSKITAAGGMKYLYDFGDSWEHLVVHEATVPSDGGMYPRCLAGRWACPPEDCGGEQGYFSLIRLLDDHEDPEHASTLEWLRGVTSVRAGKPYNPEVFDPRQVKFDDPEVRAAYINDPN